MKKTKAEKLQRKRADRLQLWYSLVAIRRASKKMRQTLFPKEER